MASFSSYYCFDFGNTEIKSGLWVDGLLTETKRFQDDEMLFTQLNLELPVAVSSVRKPETLEKLEQRFQNLFVVDSGVELPFNCAYLTPETLGIDRICNAAAMSAHPSLGPKLSIDIGTCIKFDFLNRANQYVGGSISPGFNMRFKSLKQFTANLPLVPKISNPKLIGQNTFESIQSGVQIGMYSEIMGMIGQYESQYPDLTIFMTGGDLQNFDFPQKNNIFADDNLTLKGISEIFKLNATTN